MTDAHCHVARGASRHFLCDPRDGGAGPRDVLFAGAHPWFADSFDAASLRSRLAGDPRLGVGEIGLDRLRSREIPPSARAAFEAQLEMAAEFRRPVVLHGAKCWGEVVRTIENAKRRMENGRRDGWIPAFLFHGFSRSDGLLPAIFAMNGYVSIGPAILNDHAVNYRELARKIPPDRLLVESDCTAETAAATPPVESVAAKLAEVRGCPHETLFACLEENADRFLGRRVAPSPESLV